MRCFNPRTHKGCDYDWFFVPTNLLWFQSTHPRGVRLLFSPAPTVHLSFQSTHPRGVRPTISSADRPRFLFQSTHPRGVRLWAALYEMTSCLFQSTHPRGVRQHKALLFVFCLNVSIHAPTRGATIARTRLRQFRKVSIHAPTRGATSFWCVYVGRVLCFNPRTHEGCDTRQSR